MGTVWLLAPMDGRRSILFPSLTQSIFPGKKMPCIVHLLTYYNRFSFKLSRPRFFLGYDLNLYCARSVLASSSLHKILATHGDPQVYGLISISIVQATIQISDLRKSPKGKMRRPRDVTRPQRKLAKRVRVAEGV